MVACKYKIRLNTCGLVSKKFEYSIFEIIAQCHNLVFKNQVSISSISYTVHK